MAAAATTADNAASAPPAPAKRGGLGLVLAAILGSAAASGGVGWWVIQHGVAGAGGGAGQEAAKAEHAVAKAPALYLPLTPAFVVNLEDENTSRYLQAEVEVMARDSALIEAVKNHLPRIRNALLMRFGQQHAADLAQRAGKEKLQAAVLADVQAILIEEGAAKAGSNVEAVYFTSFVMQ